MEWAQCQVPLRAADRSLGIGHEVIRWLRPLAARAAHDLGTTATTRELLIQLDNCPAGHLAPMPGAECNLVRARLATHAGDPAAGGVLAAAVHSLREQSTPCHLAHGLLDHAQHLLSPDDSEDATAAISEARGIAEHLACRPLLDRVDELTPAKPGVRA